MKVVVFDMDGTLTEEVGFMLKHAPQFLKKVYGLEVAEINPNAYKLSEVYNLQTLFREKGYKELEAKNKAEQVSQEFWNRYFLKYCKEPLKQGVKETIDLLRKQGYAIHIVTMRGKKTNLKETIKSRFIRKRVIPLLTKRQLNKAHIKIDYLEMPETVENKIEYISAINPTYVFEDQAEIINQIKDKLGSKSKVICVNNPYNLEEKFSYRVMRIANFNDDLLKTELKNEVLCTIKTHKKHVPNIFYRVIKILGTPIAYFYYKPIVFRKDIIPKEKSIAFVGNHRSKSDPIILIAVINQIIHFAALQRMFDGGEDLFSNSKNKWRCKLSALFLKQMGAVPIARPEHDDYQNINLKTIRFLTRQLKEGRASVGFFPEGTLNRNYEKQDLLPLKSNRIFKVVSVSGNYIQPFSIVWIPNNKAIRNKVIITFGNPINSEDREIDELSMLWRNEVESGIRKANEFVEFLKEVDLENEGRWHKHKKVKEKLLEFSAEW